jgi:uncharacterized membrane protein
VTATAERLDPLEEELARPRELRGLPWLLIVAGAIGLLASAVLLVEKIRLIEDPSYVPTCSINPVLSCGSVMLSEQAEVFGFPNPLLGLVGFALVVATGAALLAGARLARWYWLGLQAGVVAGVAFVAFLVLSSLYSIEALCPYCMVVWAATLVLAWGVTVHNTRSGALALPRAAANVVSDYAVLLLTLPFLLVAALAAERFWDYWRTLLP